MAQPPQTPAPTAQLGWSFSLVRTTDSPLDASSVWETQAELDAYLAGPFCYPGQLVAVRNGTSPDEYDVFVIQHDLTPGPIGTGGGPGGGPQGAQGFQGAQGAQGSQGPMGAAVAIRGMQGSQGAIEALPPPHEPGDLWIAEDTGDGFVWDGTEFVNVGRIQGPQGAAGEQGAQGHTGAGTQGPQGAVGPQGVGPQGAQGGAGWQGERGAQGATGMQGAQGHQGAGNQGAQGAQGSQGHQGALGQQGSQGSQGALAALIGDVTGPGWDTSVMQLRGTPIALMAGAAGPTEGQVLTWSGGAWRPMTPTGGIQGAVDPIDWDDVTRTWNDGWTWA